MKKLLRNIIIIVPSQILQLFESCIVILTLGYWYPGIVFKYVSFWYKKFNNTKKELQQEIENERDVLAEMFDDFEEELIKSRERKLEAQIKHEKSMRMRGIYDGGPVIEVLNPRKRIFDPNDLKWKLVEEEPDEDYEEQIARTDGFVIEEQNQINLPPF